MPVPVNGGLASIGGLESELDEWWEIDPDIWGAGGGGAYSNEGAGRVAYEGMGAGAGAVTLECGCI